MVQYINPSIRKQGMVFQSKIGKKLRVCMHFCNCYDVKWATRVQDVFTYAKLLALFIIKLMVDINFTRWLELPDLSIEELKISTCYLLAVTFANHLFGPFALSIPVFVALSTFGAVNGILLTSSSLFYAGACNGQMPEILTMIQEKRLTPTPSVLVMALLSALYLTVSDIDVLINYVGFATWLKYSVSVLCLPWLRWKRPDLDRPIKVHLIWPVIYLIATVFVTVVPIVASPYETGMGFLMIFSSVPVYFVCISWKPKPWWLQNFFDSITVSLQSSLLVLGNRKEATIQEWISIKLDPLQYGWKKNQKGNFMPIQSTEDVAPSELLKLIFYNCKG
ncbi:large neutral amino acids transporter small subunit 2-like, partial [Sitophilus oryzae]|uniref:Large neutral amino acids transporter small subunit 2-like n=1 Tax=Sitophilus oryzae TaxID=7048 RepID=A0A6J2X2M1_SITOR